MIGFLPGFAYMGKLDESIFTNRKDTPTSIAAGSVAIAGNQTGIYPVDSPGGWNVIGQTPYKIFDVNKEQPCLMNMGDLVQFKAITFAEFEQMKQ